MARDGDHEMQSLPALGEDEDGSPAVGFVNRLPHGVARHRYVGVICLVRQRIRPRHRVTAQRRDHWIAVVKGRAHGVLAQTHAHTLGNRIDLGQAATRDGSDDEFMPETVLSMAARTSPLESGTSV